ncbi:MAG: helix-turn-helix transcriptional regulator [Oscillospiraceae bacterium]|nr:helix-turn-helix transcriptional regulator [Oscillospiraceae bacterium]
MTLGEKILALRKARGWSQEELAGRIGVTRQALSRWESDTAVPDTVNVVELSDLFGVSCDYLLREKWTEDRVAVPQRKDSLEQRIVAWVVTVLGMAGVLVMTIQWSIAHTNMGPFEYWFLGDLLWLYLLSWALLVIGIAEVRGGKFSELFHDVLHEASPKKIRQDLGLDDEAKK